LGNFTFKENLRFKFWQCKIDLEGFINEGLNFILPSFEFFDFSSRTFF
jgi:hypothetical protein